MNDTTKLKIKYTMQGVAIAVVCFGLLWLGAVLNTSSLSQ